MSQDNKKFEHMSDDSVIFDEDSSVILKTESLTSTNLSSKKLSEYRRDYEFDFQIRVTHFYYEETSNEKKLRCSFTLDETEFKKFSLTKFLNLFAKKPDLSEKRFYENLLNINFENRYDLCMVKKTYKNLSTIFTCSINHDDNFIVKINNQKKIDNFNDLEEQNVSALKPYLVTAPTDDQNDQTRLFIRTNIFYLFYSLF